MSPAATDLYRSRSILPQSKHNRTCKVARESRRAATNVLSIFCPEPLKRCWLLTRRRRPPPAVVVEVRISGLVTRELLCVEGGDRCGRENGRQEEISWSQSTFPAERKNEMSLKGYVTPGCWQCHDKVRSRRSWHFPSFGDRRTGWTHFVHFRDELDSSSSRWM